MFDIMPKLGTYGIALIGGAGTIGMSMPAIETSAGASAAGWSGLAIGAFSAILAITGMIMSFMDRRKVSESETDKEIIKSLEGTIGFLKNQNVTLQKEFEEARQRSHDIADNAHNLLLKKETQLATIRAWCRGSGLDIPEFGEEIESENPTFPKSQSQPIKIQ